MRGGRNGRNRDVVRVRGISEWRTAPGANSAGDGGAGGEGGEGAAASLRLRPELSAPSAIDVRSERSISALVYDRQASRRLLTRPRDALTAWRTLECRHEQKNRGRRCRFLYPRKVTKPVAATSLDSSGILAPASFKNKKLDSKRQKRSTLKVLKACPD